MNKIYRYLFIAFGFLLSINQGVTIVLGTLQTGVQRGADIFMPVDIPVYLLLILKNDRSKRSKYRNQVSTIKVLLFLFLVWSLSGEFVSVEPPEFRFGFVHLTRAIIIAYCVLTRLTQKPELLSFVKGMMYGLLFQAFIGVWQWQIGPLYIPFFEMYPTWRSTGTIAVANAYGVYLISLLPLAIRLALFTDIKPKLLWYAISVLAAGALFASYTRGAWLAFVLAMALFFVLDFKNQKLNSKQLSLFMFMSVVAMVFIGVKYGEEISSRMSDTSESLMGEKKHSRMGMARDAMKVIDKNKIFGVGLNNYNFHADEEMQGTRIVHNAYLLIMAQQGVPGFLLFAILHFLAFRSGYKIKHTRDNQLYHIGMATLCGFTAVLIYHNVAPDYRTILVLWQHWRLVAMVVAIVVVEDITRKTLIQKQIYLQQLNRRKGKDIPSFIPNSTA